MSLHKLTAGSGYDYLTRQVAAQDGTEKGHTGLASYYAGKGETPGRWVGSGMAGIDGLAVGDVVTAEQMQALFGSGHHPLAQQRRQQLQGPGLTDRDYQAVTRLGVPYKVYAHDVSAFRLQVAQRIANLNADQAGAVSMEERARIRTDVALELFHAEHGRDPEDAREIAATIAKHSRPRTTAVAGYDLTFSPVKSVSTLWAVADPATAARIERAHQAAVKDALRFLEEHALYTRMGTNGVRQVNVQGLVATAFTHRDSRAGDPDLHTHVAVANKVQTDDADGAGHWLSIDGRVLYKANVTASETYNTALEKHLTADLGLRFDDRPNGDPAADPRKRPIREVVGVDPRLNERWSARRASIQARRGQLAQQFQATHRRPPTEVESIQLAQQATLETREAKKQPRSLAEQRHTWRAQAAELLGGDLAVTAMVRSAVTPDRGAAVPPVLRVDASWVRDTASQILATIESRRSTWQVWHVRAEALRKVRSAQLAQVGPPDVDRVVDLLVAEVLDQRSVRLTPAGDGIAEPSQLRRRDDSSVYTVHGAEQHTSARVLAAEQRILATAGRTGGRAVPVEAVDLALLETTANGVTLNAGQVALVRGMATSGARLQLAIAPAGAGKTTAMRALAAAWENGGGTLIGLAPSAAAAAALRDQIDTGDRRHSSVQTDTLAKLTWSIQHPHLSEVPPWARHIGPDTLVVIDEAGMADTMSLDTVVQFITSRGASLRLIGDDQQLAAIGAGGVLRDLDATHGALRLTELTRFADPAEGAASLALREGQPEALGFYLDNSRVHVGDLSTMTEDVFSAWQVDRARGLDAIMLAPTRELVAALNQRARAHRLAGSDQARTASPAGPAVLLADGNHASLGDLIITRTNDRRLRVSGSDWVKNGDRWTVIQVGDVDRRGGPGGSLTVQHARNGRVIHLPSDYVAASAELGYATTVHGAQGVSVDAVHGLATGQESRQQLYTMLTRGRLSNQVYLEVVSDGDPHNAIRPDSIAPPTATDLLQRILAKDDSPVSATTMLRELDDPATLLGQAAARYTDALYVAAEDLLGREAVSTLERTADALLPGLTEAAAWPTLRTHLILLSAQGDDPATALTRAFQGRELDSAEDPAAVLDWRLDDTGMRNASRGPLHWLPAVPTTMTQHPTWGDYLRRREALVEDLAAQVRTTAPQSETPPWARQGAGRPAPEVLAEVAVWRAAMQVPEGDRRPTGPLQMQKAAARWQQQLTRDIAGVRAPALQEWGDVLLRAAPPARHDDFTPLLAERLAAVSRAGLPARRMLNAALAEGSLPDDHAAAALWWRLSRHLAPAVAAEVDHGHTLTSGWISLLVERVGQDRVEHMQASTLWPALVTSIDHAVQRGWPLSDVLGTTTGDDTDDTDLDPCQAMVWRLSVLTDPPPQAEDRETAPHPEEATPEDFSAPREGELLHAPTPQQWQEWGARQGTPAAEPSPSAQDTPAVATTSPLRQVVEPVDEPVDVDMHLQLAAIMRSVMGPLEPSDAAIERQVARAAALDFAPVQAARMLQVNRLAQAFFQSHYPQSWAQRYLTDRLGQDPAEHPLFSPGYAPAGWTTLVAHLRGLGVTDQEMTETGVATRARTGRLIDRFRDRAVMPIVDGGQVLGFVGRRHPALTDEDQAGPKYLNTADTPLYHKGAQLFGLVPALLEQGATPVLVEGPLDAWAVTLATNGAHVGAAPLGTALTEEQAEQLARIGRAPVVATDADLPGRVAAERDFWMLAQHGLDPTAAAFPEGCDPADMLARQGPAALAGALARAAPLADQLIQERLTNLTSDAALTQATQVAAARPADAWGRAANSIAARLGVPEHAAGAGLLNAADAWNRDPRKAAAARLTDVQQVRDRMTAAHQRNPADRWLDVARHIDPRLPSEGDWPALAAIMALAQRDGHDVAAIARQLVDADPLGHWPAQDLRYRLVAALPLDTIPAPFHPKGTQSGAGRHRPAGATQRERPTAYRR
ncbi:MAG TPA: MobF family relaxase [Dermatophilaceae bacterium]|nr:MobF family relaxase [Dermatophilaceae bacterium]